MRKKNPGKNRRRGTPRGLVSQNRVQIDYELVLVAGERAAFYVGVEVVAPAEAAALATAVEASQLGQAPPVSMAPAIALDVLHQRKVLLRRPRALSWPHVHLRSRLHLFT